jgi:hypothetical protein
MNAPGVSRRSRQLEIVFHEMVALALHLRDVGRQIGAETSDIGTSLPAETQERLRSANTHGACVRHLAAHMGWLVDQAAELADLPNASWGDSADWLLPESFAQAKQSGEAAR